MRVFLTGGTGFIGSHITQALLQKGHSVTLMVRNPEKAELFRGHNGVSLVEGTLESLEGVEKCIQAHDACVHVALNYHPERGPMALLDDTVPTVKLAQMASVNGVKQFLYTSSTSVHDAYYGDTPGQPGETVVLNPKVSPMPATFYGATKAACESFLLAFSHQSNMRVNVIRPGYTFGNPVLPGAPVQADRRFAELARAAVTGADITLDRNDGTQFVHAGDLAALYCAVLESDLNRKIYYGLSRPFVTWGSLAEILIEKTASDSRLVLTGDLEKKGGLFWDVSPAEQDFGLCFDPWPMLLEHLDYWISVASG